MFGALVSESDLAELEARRSGLDNDLDSDSDTITGASLSSIPTNVATYDQNNIESNNYGINVIHGGKDLNKEATDSLHVTIIEPNANNTYGNLSNGVNISQIICTDVIEKSINPTVSSNDNDKVKVNNFKKMCDAGTDPEEVPVISGRKYLFHNHNIYYYSHSNIMETSKNILMFSI